MQPHDFMYALHVVSMYLHNNRHAQNVCVHMVDLITPNSILIPYTSHRLSVSDSCFACFYFRLCIILSFHVNYMHRIL